MGKDLIDLTFCRENPEETWGFQLAGGTDLGQPLSIAQVAKDSLAAKVGLNADDHLVIINGHQTANMTHSQAERAIAEAGDRFQMTIERNAAGRKISFEKSAMTVSLKLGGAPTVAKVDEAFMSNVPFTEDTPSLLDGSVELSKKPAPRAPAEPLDMRKTYNRKDWNCPWVSKDGNRLKNAIRAVEEPVAAAKTSWQHYYSEPKSILATEPLLTPEQLQELIREHGGESRPSSSLQVQNEERQVELERGVEQEMRQEAAMFNQQESFQAASMTESVREESYQAANMTETVREEQQNYYAEREEDSQAPPDLEPVTPQPPEMVGEQGSYEPSADELIDVLKNLENLAAANPGLYRDIVSQIKASTSEEGEQLSGEQEYMNQGSQAVYEEQQQAYYEQQQQMEFYQEESRTQYEQELSSEQQQYEVNGAQYEQELYEQQTQEIHQEERHEEHTTTTTSSSSMVQEVKETEEEKAQRLKMERLEREAQEEVREALQKQREMKIAKAQAAHPPPPKEISVLAGDGKMVKITLGGETKEDNRKQVAEAAGLKHVPLPDADLSESAWAGSLKKTDRSKMRHKEREEPVVSPWAGSLRHVEERNKKKARKDDDDDLYGTAPWMGTLRHVVHDNKVTKNFGVNQHQSKRYPDEDATNPFEGQGGSMARPAFPLTPAAIINGCAMSREEMAAREEEEEVQRIRGNLQSETVSTALLNALMPKLLKAHESKYEAIDSDEATKIMEEILAMQVGLNVDQQADANEEAEMMIRAIMQDEVGKHVYSNMADDLEAAARRKRQARKKAVKKTKKAAAADPAAPVQSAA